MSLEELRRQYTMGGLHEADLPDQPLPFFADWMQAALDNAPQEWVEPYAMTLATSGVDGVVSARIVLLRGYDDEGFVFYTNYESAKGKQLAENDHAALVFHWGYLERQVRVAGRVRKVARAKSASYFQKRPRGSQIGAVVSRQSEMLANREQLESAVTTFANEIGEKNVPLPEDWGGYLLVPREIEFWQGRQNRLHDRLVYRRAGEDDAWTLGRLSP